jgi:V/A-type H+-transporting ATPase subunit E
MARSALIDSLRSQAVRDVAAAWEAARAEAARHAADLAAALAQERRRLEQSLATDVQRVEAQGTAEAEHQARELGAAAAVALAERLLELARDELPRLCGAQRAALFEALARELPPCRWERVRVNPDDAALAARRFPEATVESDPAISGGMDVTCEDGRIDVDNTLETRLAVAWPDLLPGLVAQVAVQSRAHGTAA